jgi:hypothetical protein
MIKDMYAEKDKDKGYDTHKRIRDKEYDKYKRI